MKYKVTNHHTSMLWIILSLVVIVVISLSIALKFLIEPNEEKPHAMPKWLLVRVMASALLIICCYLYLSSF